MSVTNNTACKYFFSLIARYRNHHAVTKDLPPKTTAKPVHGTAPAGQSRVAALDRSVTDQARLAGHAVAQERENHLDATSDVLYDIFNDTNIDSGGVEWLDTRSTSPNN